MGQTMEVGNKNNEISVGMGTAYELNQQLMVKHPPLSADKIEQAKKDLALYFEGCGSTYFMMLCRERNDYTIFRLESDDKYEKAAEEVYLCLDERGEILSVNKTEDDYAYELWIRRSGLVYMFMLFPYDSAVITC